MNESTQQSASGGLDPMQLAEAIADAQAEGYLTVTEFMEPLEAARAILGRVKARRNMERITPNMRIEQHDGWSEIVGNAGRIRIRLTVDSRPAVEAVARLAASVGGSER